MTATTDEQRNRCYDAERNAAMDTLIQAAATYAQEYLSGIAQRSVAPSADAIDRLSLLGGPLPNCASAPSETLALLHEVMRISVSSWATTEEDVARSLATMLRIAAQEQR